MTFFNKKEDIMEVQLTPYGRRLLSQGKLKPEYYAFFDDDILYDSNKISQNGGTTENNSESKSRILTSTPSLKALSTNFGVEANIDTEYSKVIDHHMPYPIGTNSNVEKKTSAWDVTALSKEFDNFSLTSSLTPSNSAIKSTTVPLSIPQVNCKLEFTMSFGAPKPSIKFNALYSIQDASEFDTQVNVEDEKLVLYFMEKGAFLHGDSFETEVFLYEEDESDLKKLSFSKTPETIVNDIMIQTMPKSIPITKDNVEYWIDLLLDEEIPDEDICEGIDKLKEASIYSELELKCPERDDENINIYVSTLGDVEECD